MAAWHKQSAGSWLFGASNHDLMDHIARGRYQNSGHVPNHVRTCFQLQLVFQLLSTLRNESSEVRRRERLETNGSASLASGLEAHELPSHLLGRGGEQRLKRASVRPRPRSMGDHGNNASESRGDLMGVCSNHMDHMELKPSVWKMMEKGLPALFPE